MCLEASSSPSPAAAAAAAMSSSGGQTPPKVEPEQQQQQEAQEPQQQQQHQQIATSPASSPAAAVSRSASPMEYPTDASVLKERYSHMQEDCENSQDLDMDSDSNPGTNSNDESNKQQQPLKYMNGLDEMDLMERNSFMAGMARHRYMLGAAAMAQDTSKLLRGILQSKEKRLSGAPLDPEEQEMYVKMQERAALFRHTSFDTDFDSMPSGTPGDISEDSDQENQVGDNNYENSLSDDGKEKNNSENGDVTEVKRARVDSIINNLHMSPYKPLSELSQGELRRPKKKKVPTATLR